MKKLIVFIGIIACSFAVKAQGQFDEQFDQMREEMKLHMEDMMQQFDKSFDMMEGSMIKIDTFFTESFGQIDEDGNFQPNKNLEGFMKEMEAAMSKHFSDLNFEDFDTNDREPAVPGPEELDEKEGKSKKQSRKLKSKKSKRKTTNL